MQINRILLMVCLCTISFFSHAQQTGAVRGNIKDPSGTPLSAITVRISGVNRATVSNAQGNYTFINVGTGHHTVIFSAVGYKKTEKKTEVTAGRESVVDVTLEDNLVDLEAITVTGRTKVQEINRQAFNVTAVDAKQLYNTTLDLSSALDRVSGVRVRESGGVGSDFNLSINGFSGNRVKYFLDGVPIDNFGTSFQINNIPINVAERVEVYKGVVPVWLGSDALGGAINIVTGDRSPNYIDASYSYGSFNTHRSVINGAFTTKKGFTVRLSAFQNYSDNNYPVTVDASDIYTGAYTRNAVVRRFHDTYHNETLIASVGVVNKKFADQLLFGITLGQNYKEYQTGARMVAVKGAWFRDGNIVMPTFRYRKNDIIKGLDVAVSGNYNLGQERNIDTASRSYDWYGNYKPNKAGGEFRPSLAKYRNNNGLLTANANYRLAEHQTLSVNNVFSTFSRKGTDLIGSLVGQPQVKPSLQKDVLGAGYSYDDKNKWSFTLFGKYLYQRTAQKTTFNRFGFGTAGSYYVSPNLQLKASYERANRLPEATELFGDVGLVQGNPSLSPEQSDNINAGLTYNFNLNHNNHFLLNASAVYRHSDNYIYQRFNQNQTALILDNLAGVSTIGGEGEIRYSYKKWFSAGSTITYQYIKNLQRLVYDPNGNLVVSLVYKDQLPNIPFFFGNSDASVTLHNVGNKGNTLNLDYHFLYVHAFWLYWPKLGGQDETEKKYGIPMQFSHDVSAVYSLKNGRYNIGLEVRNITDNRQYDNFSLQKPGRGYYLNLRYFFNSFKI